MSISCDIYLPNDVRTDDVLNVIGILLNHGKSKIYFDNYNSFYCEVEDVDIYFPVNGRDQEVQERKNIYVLPGHIPNMFTVHIQKNQIDNVKDHMAFFHYDTDTENGMRLISGGNSDFWKKVGKGLVTFFGGYVNYNDCDNIGKDFESMNPRYRNNPVDDAEWEQFQQDMLDLMPIEP